MKTKLTKIGKFSMIWIIINTYYFEALMIFNFILDLKMTEFFLTMYFSLIILALFLLGYEGLIPLIQKIKLEFADLNPEYLTDRTIIIESKENSKDFQLFNYRNF